MKLMERDRRRRKKRRRNRKTTRKGFVFLVLLLVIIGAAGVLKMTKAVPGLFRESGNVLLSDSGQKIEFPELNVSEEDVADGFYYQQLSEQEKQVYESYVRSCRGFVPWKRPFFFMQARTMRLERYTNI